MSKVYMILTDDLESVTLHADDIIIAESGYSMSPAQLQETSSNDGFADGDRITRIRRGNVKEKISLLFKGGVNIAVANIETANRILSRATRRVNKPKGGKAYLQLKINEGDSYWTAEVFGGTLALGKDALDMEVVNGLLSATLECIREPLWEGPLTAVPLTNGNGTNNTSGLTIRNHDDATTGDDNYVQIAAASILGDAPADLKMLIKNTDATTANVATVYVGQNVVHDPANYVPTLESDVATAGSSVSSSTTSDAAYSGGSYKTFSWASSIETELCYWTLSSSFLAKCKNGYFRLLLRSISAANFQIKAKVRIGSNVLISTGWINYQPGVDTQDLFSFKLPPFGKNMTFSRDLVLSLYVKSADATSRSIAIDFAQLFPLDGWHKLQPLTADGVETNYTLVVDSTEDEIYTLDASNKAVGDYIAEGRPLQLWPNELQRFYFLWTDTAGDSLPARTMTVQLMYRPRRFTL